MQNSQKTAYISFDLIFDYKSYLFCIARSYLCEHNLTLENSEKLKYEKKNLQQVFRLLDEQKLNQQGKFDDFNKLFKNYLCTVKPQFGSIELISILKQQSYNIISGIEDYQELKNEVQHLKQHNIQWMNDVQILEDAQQNIVQKSNKYGLIFSGDIQFLKDIYQNSENKEQKLVYVKNHNLHNKEPLEIEKLFEGFKNLDKGRVYATSLIEDLNFENIFNQRINFEFPQKEYFLKLKEEPKNLTFQGFQVAKKLDNFIEVQGPVVEGFGKAGSQLGIFTANIDITKKEIQEKIKSLPTGVYAGTVQSEYFENIGDKRKELGSLIFIGNSQYFEDSKKQLEVYVYQDFDKTFYGQEIKVKIEQFQRCDADFKDFDHLIKYIHNDVWQGKRYLEDRIQLNI